MPDFRFSLGRISDCSRIEETLKMVLRVSTRGYMSIVAVAFSMSTAHGLRMDDVPDSNSDVDVDPNSDLPFPDVDLAPYCDVNNLHEALTETQKQFVIHFANALQFSLGIFILETNLQSWKPISFWKPILNLETSAGVSYSIQFSKSKNQFQHLGFVFNCFTSV